VEERPVANTGKNIGIGCIVIVAAIILGLMCLGSMAKEPTEVDVMVEAPLEVQQGERFTVVARVRDLSGERRELVDLTRSISASRAAVKWSSPSTPTRLTPAITRGTSTSA
jgi:hypothetical protein